LNSEQITFSFGKNWRDFVEQVTDEDVTLAMEDICQWLGEEVIRGRRVIDVGSGSGIHSLSFHKLGAESVHSFDYDPLSVESTRKLWLDAGSPSNWVVEQGSVLDSDYVRMLGQFDIVYSWGELHHTGAMWDAIKNCAGLVGPGGMLWISLYEKGPRYSQDLALKKRFNAASAMGKRLMIAQRILRSMLIRVKQGKNPFSWNQKVRRGMNVYHDIVDWLGGLPYEVASEDEVVIFARRLGFILERILVAPEGGCSKYVFSLPQATPRE
jgi:2-polyprenyl-6-hydroxyphenyl methylase/3-demethylubiquinone-9 3-methyltransferase